MTRISDRNILKKINQLFHDKLKFCIVMTTELDKSLGIEALKLGADDFFQKPILARAEVSHNEGSGSGFRFRNSGTRHLIPDSVGSMRSGIRGPTNWHVRTKET